MNHPGYDCQRTTRMLTAKRTKNCIVAETQRKPQSANTNTRKKNLGFITKSHVSLPRTTREMLVFVEGLYPFRHTARAKLTPLSASIRSQSIRTYDPPSRQCSANRMSFPLRERVSQEGKETLQWIAAHGKSIVMCQGPHRTPIVKLEIRNREIKTKEPTHLVVKRTLVKRSKVIANRTTRTWNKMKEVNANQNRKSQTKETTYLPDSPLKTSVCWSLSWKW